ncbi:probable tubulin polyglutamylase TTLL9 [Leptopilina heterotoma]|uniref:probable tubulin polyglutamylase TTLL9 n=1 Tax=Leptopilina heterotoma TaxID=63436 RepID=UPI001CA8BC8E|nr:probable tubulin polyglutamylase TTLL9 [Leptopilina heterotoma]
MELLKNGEIINSWISAFSISDRKHYPNAKKRRYHKVIKFRCDFPSTQVKVMLARGWVQIDDPNDTDWNLWWCETNDIRLAFENKLAPHQRVPHFRNHYELTRKNYLYRNLKRYEKLLINSGKQNEGKFCSSMPITFELPNEYRMLVEEYRKQQGSTWIVKPVTGSQGRGIFLFRKLKDLYEWKPKESTANASTTHTNAGKVETFVVQKYVENPYLLAGRKFDLRIYVLVTSFHPLKVWLAREGFARLSGELFALDKIDDSRIHLTNMAIQLKGRSLDDEKHSSPENSKHGYKWSLRKVREYMTARHGVTAVNNLLSRIAGVIMASLQAVQPVMMQENNSFELYGYDILLDEHLTPWLLEVNASPALAPTDHEDYRVKFDILDDVLNILDLERMLTGSEIRVGGFDLLWNDAPVWITCPNPLPCGNEPLNCPTHLKRLNIFLGARNNRVEQLRQLHESLKDNL